MTEGTSNLRASTLHAESRDHKEAITDEVQSKTLAYKYMAELSCS